MEQDQITFISYISGSFIFAALILVFIYLWRTRATHWALIIPAIVSLFWHLSIAANYSGYTLDRPLLLLLEASRYGAWIVAVLACLKFATGQRIPLKIRIIIHSVWLSAFAGTLWLFWQDSTLAYNTDLLIWMNLCLSITGLVSVEQLYRNTNQSRLIKLLGVTIGALFAYDIYLFSHSLIFNQIDQNLWQARGAINGIIALVMALGSLAIANQSHDQAKLSFSRPVVFYTTSLTAAGSFLSLMAMGGFYVQTYGGEWGTIVQVVLLFLALLSITAVFASNSIQARLNVWINKNFFHHKYDYRVEWLKLINSLAQPTSDGNFHKRALQIITSIFKSPSGGLWLPDQGDYKPVSIIGGMVLPSGDLTVAMEQPFCTALKENEWVFSPFSPSHKDVGPQNSLLPLWTDQIADLWLILPLLTESELIGFVVLSKPKHNPMITWEDLDLLKTVGRQIASYLEKHEAAELIAETKQFEAFNKLTAFIMHDLKNLIAQQGLVVANAAKHKENPAFIDDAISTIDNSVKRMNALLAKLQQDEPSEFRSLKLHKVLMEAVKRCQQLKPTPSLRFEEDDFHISADLDRIIMTFTHIIKNAQEATDNSGFIDVTLRREGKNVIISIEDNGSGMNEDFIRNQLFKPFVTTKSGKGMGIGVYQTKEYISSLGGSVWVDSTPGEGTTFTITLPEA
jgi:putative PEP-CTERM system histidine kinase